MQGVRGPVAGGVGGPEGPRKPNAGARKLAGWRPANFSSLNIICNCECRNVENVENVSEPQTRAGPLLPFSFSIPSCFFYIDFKHQ